MRAGLCSRYRRGQDHQPNSPRSFALRTRYPYPRAVDFQHRRGNGAGQERECPVPNPMLNEKKLEEARSGWAAPQAPSPGGEVWPPPVEPRTRVDDGPVSPWAGAMTMSGTISATAVLFVLLLGERHRRLADDGDDRGRAELPEHRDDRGHRRLRLRDRPLVPSPVGEGARPDLCPRPRVLRRCDLEGVRRGLPGHRRAGRRRHARRVRGDARALPHPDHQGHRPHAPHHHLRHPRRDGAVPRLVRGLAVRRRTSR